MPEAEIPEEMDEFVQPESAPPTVDSPEVPVDHDATKTVSSVLETFTSTKKDAFAELMSHKQPSKKLMKPPRSLAEKAGKVIGGVWRGALGPFIEHPEKYPDQVLRVTEHTVLIKDRYPKATIHLLLLPRSKEHNLLHPHTAMADPAFLKIMRAEAETAAQLAAAELQRLLGRFSEKNRSRNEAIDACVPFDELPPGRDYRKDIRVGTHAHPSMAHVHVHIISRDMRSESLKRVKHYNSFNTPFFIPLEDYPLGEEDERWSTSYQNNNLTGDMVCWRCKKNFGHKFAELKRHLEEEFEAWKRE
ncbi:uncharacterized protein CTHT_0036990 [Thermochaetoides thermophila DSM 1495]|jgi:Diadenosine tetraphosphate (Ap4A) hydrolase and other HIT family hydrolases|uniref:Aprataxin-like protein n=1 Tax=Chaetomium thermophilum (strain DSM 1495 / CBS 144.50 / IMI 039719) TaxID=759272 RepID=G0S7N8_CHATD|nr:hypothetical protein CTHT_0036990 [Thermochaetoides thermophila DSM 1495]EGS21829.1 hypothetical protein CTHT_0036990 [Thermochaetoides thermophila DSM 1495]